ncbi:phage tail protein [Escherichia coli]|uniref:phage tail protein n=1 Tax=Escherichia coli TaxID=562 RepID=UPI000DFF321E|nr:phage tail collar protein [Escherichia coli]
MAVGDANGVLPTPNPAQTKLINQKRIAPLNLLSVDPNNQSQIIAEQIILKTREDSGSREIGLYDDKGVLIAVANCPETYKPQLQEGSGRTQTIRMILVVTNTKAITLKSTRLWFWQPANMWMIKSQSTSSHDVTRTPR